MSLKFVNNVFSFHDYLPAVGLSVFKQAARWIKGDRFGYSLKHRDVTFTVTNSDTTLPAGIVLGHQLVEIFGFAGVKKGVYFTSQVTVFDLVD
jgi:hypothetical protein